MKTCLVPFLASIALAGITLAGPEPLPESKAVIAPKPEPYNWQGFYIGVNGGYAFDFSNEVTDLDFLNVGPPPDGFSFDSEGPVGGAQIGFNWHAWQIFSDPLALILGVEGDGGYFGVYGHQRQPTSPDPGTFAKINPGAYATARGRIGLAWDRWLLYATGGWIGSDYERKIVDDELCNCAPGVRLGSAEDEDWRSGWTVGGGLEWAFRDHWTLRVEYLYFNFGDGTVTVPIFRTGPFRFGFDDDGNIIRGGLNFKF